MPHAPRHPTRFLAAALLGLGMLLSLAAPARAVIMTYTLTGNITGTLGADNFADTPFTWTQTGDTTAPTIVLSLPARAAITSTIQIGALSLATPSAGFFIFFHDPTDLVGFSNSGTNQGIRFVTAALDGYDFLAIGPVGVTFVDTLPIGTDQGVLTINKTTTAPPTNLVFTAAEATAAIPEPASLALLASGLFGLGLLRRRG